MFGAPDTSERGPSSAVVPMAEEAGSAYVRGLALCSLARAWLMGSRSRTGTPSSPAATDVGSAETSEGCVVTPEGRGDRTVSWGPAPESSPDMGVGDGTVGSSCASVGAAAGWLLLDVVERAAAGRAAGVRALDVPPWIGVAVTMELAADVEESTVGGLAGCGDGVSATCMPWLERRVGSGEGEANAMGPLGSTIFGVPLAENGLGAVGHGSGDGTDKFGEGAIASLGKLIAAGGCDRCTLGL